MRGAAPTGADDRRALKSAVVQLVVLVVLLDGVFVGLYGLLHLERATAPARAGYTVVWTLLTLLVVVRALGRIRALRLRRRRAAGR